MRASHDSSIACFWHPLGAAKMCADYGVPFLGKVPLDPLIAQAAEKGLSLFDETTEHSPSYSAVKRVVDGVRKALE